MLFQALAVSMVTAVGELSLGCTAAACALSDDTFTSAAEVRPGLPAVQCWAVVFDLMS